MNLLPVPPDKAAQMPAVVWNHIANAVNRVGLSSPTDVQFDVVSGVAVLWVAVEEPAKIVGAGVTQIEACQGKRICTILAWGADDHRRCAPLLSIIDDYAHAEGCAAVRLFGREGWRRKLPGFELKAIIMEKAL